MAADLDFWEPQADPLFPRSRSGKVRPCPHCQRRHRAWLIGIIAVLSILAGVVTAWQTVPAPAYSGAASFPAAASAPAEAPAHAVLASATLGDAILNSAESRAGDWYSWAGAGPSVFDCSGLVVWSAARHGIYLPHSTYLMVSSPHLYRVYAPRRGDLAFFGTGHVEFVTIWYHTTFGAHHSGTRVGWSHYDPRYYGPTAFYRIR